MTPITNQRGFTFIELLVALSLFIVGMLSVLQIFPVTQRLLDQTGETTQAAFLAQAELEELRSVPYDSLTVGTYQAATPVTTDQTSPYAIYNQEVDVSVVSGAATGAGLKKVEVIITWQGHGIARNYHLATYTSSI